MVQVSKPHISRTTLTRTLVGRQKLVGREINLILTLTLTLPS